MDLNELVKDLRPNVLTPHLEEVMKANPASRGNVIARHILRAMVRQKGKIGPLDILHGDSTQTVRFLDAEALCEGPWALYSLALLNISYGEQAMVIEALYPEKKQLMAKAFAALFSRDVPVSTPKREDGDLLRSMEDANAGIAMILARLGTEGVSVHADQVGEQRKAMRRLAEGAAERDRFHKGYEKSQQKYRKGDRS